MIQQFSNLFQSCIDATKRFWNENYTYQASALAFTTLLTLVPTLSVIVFVTSIFPIFTQAINLAQEYVFANFLPASSQIIQTYLTSFVDKSRHLPGIGIVFLFFTVGMLITTILHSFDNIWHTGHKKRRKTTWLIYYLILIIIPVFIGISVLFTTYIFSFSWFVNQTVHYSEMYFFSVFPFLIDFVILSLLYIVVPNCPVKARHGMLGGFVGAFLFEVAKKSFAIYIHYFTNYELIYGILAAIPIFLVWVYLAWSIVIFGALVAQSQTKIKY